MEWRLRRLSFVSLLRFTPSHRDSAGGDRRRHKGRDFALMLMLAAVAGVVCQAIGTAIELGRSAGWWQ